MYETWGGGGHYTSKNQKINMKISTEAEVVGRYDLIPQILLTHHFLDGKVLTPIHLVVCQGNKSAITMKFNGKDSSGKQMRCMNIIEGNYPFSVTRK